MIPVAGKLRLATRTEESRAAAAGFTALETAWDVRMQVAAAFYDLYRVERAVAIAEDTRRLMQDVAGVAEAMYRVGEAPQSDVLKARVEVARMTEEIVAMQAMREVSLARLAGLLDRAVGPAMPSAALPAFPESIPAREALEEMAFATRPMLRAGEAEVAAAASRRTLAYREIYPDVEVGVQYGQRGASGMVERMGSLMLGVSVPVFARRRQLPMREEASAMHAMASADLAAMRADTRARIGIAYAELQRARNLQRLYRNTVLPQARAAVQASAAAYRVGRVNLMTLLDDQATVNRYAQEFAALEAMEGLALAEIEMLVGQELFDASSARE